jgi:hypothetical protein
MAVKKAPEDLRTMLVETRKEKFKITIPADWKVTFGKPMQGRGYEDENSRELRIYEAETKQRACFTGVLSFRDLSIPMLRLVTETNGSTIWADDGLGNIAETRQVKRKTREVAA